MEPVIEQMSPWLGEEEALAVADYLRGGAWLTEFEKTAALEQEIARFAGCRHAVMVSSGTAALYCALKACGIGPGDDVVVPDMTMIASANAVVLAGARPVLADISPAHLCLDPDKVESALTPRTRAIVLVSLNGRAPEMSDIRGICDRHSIHVVEDAAQSLGSFQRGRHLGTFGVAGIFSFSPMKVITTGQGGAVVTNEADIAERVRRHKDFGRVRGGQDVHESIGYNFKFTDVQAVIGLEQMKKLAWRLSRKKQMFQLYRALLEDVPGLRFVATDLNETAPWFMDVLTDRRDELVQYLRNANIKTRPFYPPIHSQPAYQISGAYPVSEETSRRGLWLPSSSFLTDEQIASICDRIRVFHEIARPAAHTQ